MLPPNGYPLIRTFPQADYTTVYDARAHFATNLRHDQVALFMHFLCHEQPPNDLTPEDDRTWSLLTLLRNRGVFLSGSFTETFTVDESDLHRIVDHYDKYVVTRKFCLEVTEQCNFRCTYCPYSNSANERRHSDKRMSRDTAKKAIDQYFHRYTKQFSSLSSSAKEHVLDSAPPSLSWYGGECFLNFDVVRFSQEYFQSLPWKSCGLDSTHLRYSANTNFSVANPEVFEFLVRNNVLVYLSLDGPKEQNDLHRLSRSGKGTFESVICNLKALQKKHPEYVRRNVVILATSCDDHDHELCVSFLDTLGIPIVRSEMQVLGSTIPNPRAKLRRIQERDELIPSLLTALKDDDPAEFVKKTGTSRLLSDAIKSLDRQYFSVSTCIPAPHPANEVPTLGMRTCPVGFDQLMVAANGTFHMCHKTDGSLPIGNSDIGYDHRAIVSLYRDFHQALNSPQCRSCWAIRFCAICSAPLLKKGQFCLPDTDECDYIRASTVFGFSIYQVLCENPQIALEVKQRVIGKKTGVTDISQFPAI